MYEEKIKKKKLKNKKYFTLEPKEPINYKDILSNINWHKIFTKLSVLYLVIILIIFTISRISNNSKKTNNIFNDNINTLKTSLLAYYKDNALPKNTGDSSSLTLEEMHKLKLFNEIKENENLCDYINSYVILTKTNITEYTLKIYLKCPIKSNLIEEKINI